MENLVDFIARHWFLVTLFILAFLWLIYEEAQHQGAGGARQTPQGVTYLINKENAVVFDLRDANAYKSGHITGSVNMPAAGIDNNISNMKKYKQRPVVLVCSMGQQSVQVMNKLKKAGFENVYILCGGLAAWKKAELPLKKS